MNQSVRQDEKNKYFKGSKKRFHQKPFFTFEQLPSRNSTQETAFRSTPMPCRELNLDSKDRLFMWKKKSQIKQIGSPLCIPWGCCWREREGGREVRFKREQDLQRGDKSVERGICMARIGLQGCTMWSGGRGGKGTRRWEARRSKRRCRGLVEEYRGFDE